MEPDQLASQLGVSGKTIRAWLRKNFPRPPVDKGQPWSLTEEQVVAVRNHFKQSSSSSLVSSTLTKDSTGGPSLASATSVERPFTRPSFVSGRDSVRLRRHAAAERYRPATVRLLLVAEAPPRAEERYFYFTDVSSHDSLFRYVVKGLYGVTPDRTNKTEMLGRLASDGVFLIDLSEEPEGVSNLAGAVPGLIERCRALEPGAIILIKTKVYDAAFRHLRAAGLPVVDRRIPFPGSGQQQRFEVAFAHALDDAGRTPVR